MVTLIDIVANIYVVLLIVRWVVGGLLPQYANSGWFLRLRDVTDPPLDAIRRAVPTLGGFDFSYIIAIVAVKVIANLLKLIW